MPTGLGGEVIWLCPSLDDSPNDLSGNGNNGTYVNGTATVADSDPTYGGSRAYSFDQTNDYINCGDTESYPADMTLSVWVNALSFSNGNRGIVNTFDSGGIINEFGLYTTSSNSVGFRAYSNSVIVGGTLLPNTWHHFTGVRDTAAGVVKIYNDGLLISQTPITTTAPVSAVKDFVVGRYGGRFYFGGLMDDIRFYERAITQAEITRLATSRGILGGLGGTHVHRTLLGVG